jgi:hypothetical protein
LNRGEEFCLLELVSRIVLPSSEATTGLVEAFQRHCDRVLIEISLLTPIKAPLEALTRAPAVDCFLYEQNKVASYNQIAMIAYICFNINI